MSGTRSDWAALLPTLQAFVAGEPIQRMDFGGSWEDSDQMYSVLQGAKYRIKPPQHVQGVWSIGFTTRDVGSVNGAVGTGTFHWGGCDTDTPKWPVGHGITLVGDPVFTPGKRGAK